MNDVDTLQVAVQSAARKFWVRHQFVTLWHLCTRVVCTTTPARSRSRLVYQPSLLCRVSSCWLYQVWWVSVCGRLLSTASETVCVVWRSPSNSLSVLTFISLITSDTTETDTRCRRETSHDVLRVDVIIIIIIIIIIITPSTRVKLLLFAVHQDDTQWQTTNYTCKGNDCVEM